MIDAVRIGALRAVAVAGGTKWTPGRQAGAFYVQTCTLQQHVGLVLLLGPVMGLVLFHFGHRVERGQRCGQHVAMLYVEEAQVRLIEIDHFRFGWWRCYGCLRPVTRRIAVLRHCYWRRRDCGFKTRTSRVLTHPIDYVLRVQVEETSHNCNTCPALHITNSLLLLLGIESINQLIN